MYQISELAKMVGVTRSTLLYYEKLGLIKGVRRANGYRTYSQKDLQRLQRITHLHAAGLTLTECVLCLDAESDRQLLTSRLKQLEEEIARKFQAKTLLESLLGISDESAWHQGLAATSADIHLAWLQRQGMSDKEALRSHSLSKAHARTS